MIKIVKSVFNAFSENTYIVYDDVTLDSVVIDPGAYNEKEKNSLLNFIQEKNLNLRYVIATHGHFDHIGALDFLCQQTGASFAMSKLDEAIDSYNRNFFNGCGLECPQMRQIDKELSDGDILMVGPMEFHVISTPGHTPGGVSFYLPSENTVFTGDTLFKGSIGRTDFPLSSYPDIIKSILKKLMVLPMDTVVLPGHGDSTTLATERDTNPFINEVIDGDVDATI